eukprot:999594-Prymnesium_polylepis.1
MPRSAAVDEPIDYFDESTLVICIEGGQVTLEQLDVHPNDFPWESRAAANQHVTMVTVPITTPCTTWIITSDRPRSQAVPSTPILGSMRHSGNPGAVPLQSDARLPPLGTAENHGWSSAALVAGQDRARHQAQPRDQCKGRTRATLCVVGINHQEGK